MASENAVPFKVILVNKGQESEIRRFYIDKDVVTNFSYLVQKLSMIFPTLRNGPFTLSWNDQDGDSVQVCSDEELIIALTEQQTQAQKKFYISTKSHKEFPKYFQPNYTGFNSNVHAGVSCDNCNVSNITGYRYKCAMCPDYDLCSECERKQIHNEHVMIRFPFPIYKDAHYGHKFLKELGKFTKTAEKALGHGFKRGHGHCNFGRGFPFGDGAEGRHHNPSHHGHGHHNESSGANINLADIINNIATQTPKYAQQFAQQMTELAKQFESDINQTVPPSQSSWQDPNTTQPSNGQKSNGEETNGNHKESTTNSGTNDNQASAPSPSPKPSTSMETEDVAELGWSLLNKQNHIDEALERMMAMGFTNEGGWLRELLVSTNGNIEKAIGKIMVKRI